MSGNVYEIYEYEKGYLKDYEKFNPGEGGGRLAGEKSESYTENREKVLNRAKRDMRRLINSNVNQYGEKLTSKFLTLTFTENIQDLTQANYEWEKFIKRLNYKIFGNKKANLKYVVGVEFQNRGAIHYHAVFFNLPYTRFNEILQLWGNGGAWINKIDDVDNVGAYVTAYLGKDVDSRLEGRKCYFSSRGLYKPIEITDKKMVEVVSATLPKEKLKFSAQFNNEYLGDISYKQYNLNDIIMKGGDL